MRVVVAFLWKFLIVTAASVLTLWGPACAVGAAALSLAWGVGPAAIGAPPLTYLGALGVAGSIVVVIALARFALTAPLMEVSRSPYGGADLSAIVWPPRRP